VIAAGRPHAADSWTPAAARQRRLEVLIHAAGDVDGRAGDVRRSQRPPGLPACRPTTYGEDRRKQFTEVPNEIDPQLVFTVRHIDAGGVFIAAGFFPTQPPARRRLQIDPSYFAADLEYDSVGVLRHELGHVLGFRHEQIRSGAPATCPDEDTEGVVELGQYDPTSVMHYFCGGVGSKQMDISALDRAGAQLVYGPPTREPQAGQGDPHG
jgi:hypothetical protein